MGDLIVTVIGVEVPFPWTGIFSLLLDPIFEEKVSEVPLGIFRGVNILHSCL